MSGQEMRQRPLLDDGAPRSEGAWWAQSGKVDWATPEAELALVRAVAVDGVIGFDPCSNAHAAPRVAARLECMLERGQNGLSRSWRGHGLVFFNPPYGVGEVNQFTARAVREFGGDPRAPLGVDQAIGLVPANPETQWYHRDIARQADATCFREGRIAFLMPDGTAKGEATVKNLWLYFGDRPDVFLRVFAPEGDARLTPIGARRLVARGEHALALHLAQGNYFIQLSQLANKGE
jgi:hypothetical protein